MVMNGTIKKEYDVIWKHQSHHSQDSMPIGGKDVGCNVWVQKNQLCIYFGQSGAFDENGTMLKAGRIRIGLDNSELLEENFCQHFHLYDGYLSVHAGKKEEEVEILLWVDVKTSRIHVECSSKKPHKFFVFYDNWRYKEREVPNGYERHQCRDYDYDYPGFVVTYPDTVDVMENRLVFFHANKNSESVVQKAIQQQGLQEIKDVIPDYQKNLIMGGSLYSNALRFFKKERGIWQGIDQETYEMETEETVSCNLLITLHIGQYENLDEWRQALQKKEKKTTTFDSVKKWWNTFFDTSYIILDPERTCDHSFDIGRNYQLFRYMLGCNYYGKFPTKFNGGLFTFDNEFGYTPDFRAWSGTIFTSQNQRLVYWPMLKSGDFQAMKPQFDFYKCITEVGKARVRHYWKHKGACFYEQGSITGLCSCSEYSWHRREGIDPGLEDNPYVKMHFSSAIEFACMIMEYANYTDEPVEEYLEFIVSVIEFYFEHYPKDENGKLYVFPSTALETYKGKDAQSTVEEEYGCANPMDVIAGLRCVLKQLMEYLPDGRLLEQCREWFRMCPPLPVLEENGKLVYAPADEYEAVQNCELPQLYHIFPYSPRGMDSREKEIGVNTYFQKRDNPDQDLGYSWHQNGIFAARLGLTEEAFYYLHQKFDDAPKRFPAFWGPGHDYTPDHNHGGSGMIGLQEMLMQCEAEKIHLFPAWDKKIDVHFKLHAPHKTVVECKMEKGKIVLLEVIPAERKKDIVLHRG